MTLQRDALALSARDTVLLVVPMYHANAWGVVYSAPAVGAKLVLPGQRMDGESIYNLIAQEGVTYSAAVPTVWQMLLQYMQENGKRFTTLERVTIGGSACPESIIRTSIGRASCRERVCQYVYMPVGADALKKK